MLPPLSDREKARTALSTIVTSHQRELQRDPGRLRYLLNDYLPELPAVRFLTAAPIDIPWFRRMLMVRSENPSVVDRLRLDLEHIMGLQDEVSEWISDVWREAIDLPLPPRTFVDFDCPVCNQEGVAHLYWSQRKAVCPCCNTQLLFDTNLRPTIARKGWKVKRQAGGDWQLVGSSGQSRSASLRDCIWDFINSDKISNYQIANEIGLRDILSILAEPASQIMSESSRGIGTTEHRRLVQSILYGITGHCGMHFAPTIPENRLTALTMRLPNWHAEETIAMISTQDQIFEARGVLFKEDCLGYSSPATAWTLPYVSIHDLGVDYDEHSIKTIRIGSSRLISVDGLGIPRHEMKRLVKALGAASEHQQLQRALAL